MNMVTPCISSYALFKYTNIYVINYETFIFLTQNIQQPCQGFARISNLCKQNNNDTNKCDCMFVKENMRTKYVSCHNGKNK